MRWTNYKARDCFFNWPNAHCYFQTSRNSIAWTNLLRMEKQQQEKRRKFFRGLRNKTGYILNCVEWRGICQVALGQQRRPWWIIHPCSGASSTLPSSPPRCGSNEHHNPMPRHPRCDSNQRCYLRSCPPRCTWLSLTVSSEASLKMIRLSLTATWGIIHLNVNLTKSDTRKMIHHQPSTILTKRSTWGIIHLGLTRITGAAWGIIHPDVTLFTMSLEESFTWKCDPHTECHLRHDPPDITLTSMPPVTSPLQL